MKRWTDGLLGILLALFSIFSAHATDAPENLLRFAQDQSQPHALRFTAIQELAKLKSALTEDAALSFLQEAANIYAAAGDFKWDPKLGDEAPLFERVIEILTPYATEKSLDVLTGFRPVPVTSGHRMFGVAVYPCLVSALKRDSHAQKRLLDPASFLNEESPEHKIVLELNLAGDVLLSGYSEKIRYFTSEHFSQEIRIAAILALGKTDLQEQANRDRLLELLTDSSVRLRTAWSLAQLKEPRALKIIYEHYLHATNDTEHSGLVSALQAFQIPESMPFLRSIRRRDREKYMRQTTARSLATLRGYYSDYRKGHIGAIRPMTSAQRNTNALVHIKSGAETILGACERALGLSTPRLP